MFTTKPGSCNAHHRGGMPFFVFILFALCMGCGQIKGKGIVCPGPDTDPLTFEVADEGQCCDQDTYVVRATGSPDKNLTKTAQKKESARRAAVLNAKYKIRSCFSEYRMRNEMSGDMYPAEYYRGKDLWLKDLEAMLNGGEAVAIAYDPDCNCTLIFVIRHKNLMEWKEIPFEQYARQN